MPFVRADDPEEDLEGRGGEDEPGEIGDAEGSSQRKANSAPSKKGAKKVQPAKKIGSRKMQIQRYLGLIPPSGSPYNWRPGDGAWYDPVADRYGARSEPPRANGAGAGGDM
eukprot:CAMPEP_0198237170 /NCGR_PEP_ID=MMETSP1446-20131203/3014_1 /TAXON_ID=1461542 ORGANISM="Unidentified sp, Strain CCMP2111" /NCGR_SAMPLE_ID=MMETSP1446 /ASSEMBLY_ACC=CAM_ASM_001112 /LENGTH=110 /DNA_ID=CAMNT_0043919211 /DNA_START=92 /DNA_END=425 /DNA_ORIENTATION=+